MPTPNPEKLCCPKCLTPVVFTDDIPRIFTSHTYNKDTNTVTVNSSIQEMLWDGCTKERPYCPTCGTDIALPEGVTVDFD